MSRNKSGLLTKQQSSNLNDLPYHVGFMMPMHWEAWLIGGSKKIGIAERILLEGPRETQARLDSTILGQKPKHSYNIYTQFTFCGSMDGLGEYYVKWNEPVRI